MAALATPFIVAVVGILAAIAIPAFVKAREAAQWSVCADNLKKIDEAKMDLAIERNSNPGDLLPERDVLKRVKSEGCNLRCPKGGRYTLNPVGREPACSVHGTMSDAAQGQAVKKPFTSGDVLLEEETAVER